MMYILQCPTVQSATQFTCTAPCSRWLGWARDNNEREAWHVTRACYRTTPQWKTPWQYPVGDSPELDFLPKTQVRTAVSYFHVLWNSLIYLTSKYFVWVVILKYVQVPNVELSLQKYSNEGIVISRTS